VTMSETAATDDSASVGPAAGKPTWKSRIRKVVDIPESGVVAACVLVFIVVTLIKPDFANVSNLQVIGVDLALYGILAVGESIVILTSGIDLSPGSVVALCVMVTAYLNANENIPVGLCIAASVLIGMTIGYLHGWFITRLDVPPFAITLVTLTAAAGGALALTDGQSITGVSGFYAKIADTKTGGVPVPALIFAVIAIAAWIFLERTYVGRQIYAIGGNREAARLAGIPVNRRVVLPYVISGACAGVVAVIVIGYLSLGSPDVGSGWELDAIAAAVIGGVSLYGGEGRIVGVVAGVLLLMLINNALIVLNVSSFYQQVALGLVLGIAIVADRVRARSRGRARPRGLPLFGAQGSPAAAGTAGAGPVPGAGPGAGE
jgi:ribose transport system permease protein